MYSHAGAWEREHSRLFGAAFRCAVLARVIIPLVADLIPVVREQLAFPVT